MNLKISFLLFYLLHQSHFIIAKIWAENRKTLITPKELIMCQNKISLESTNKKKTHRICKQKEAQSPIPITSQQPIYNFVVFFLCCAWTFLKRYLCTFSFIQNDNKTKWKINSTQMSIDSFHLHDFIVSCRFFYSCFELCILLMFFLLTSFETRVNLLACYLQYNRQ